MTEMPARVLEGRPRDLGGFSVRRVLPAGRLQTVGPFIFFDHMGPATFAAGGGVDVRPHPHIGLATVTYLFAGEFMHRDSLGSEQLIRPGDVNWMVAGRGIQTWIALPREHEEATPSFEHHPAATLPEFHGAGVTMRLIAGSAYGRRAPTSVFSPMFYLAVELEPEAVLELPDEHAERALYVVEGEVEVAGELHPAGRMILFGEGSPAAIRARSWSRAMLLGGAPLDGPRHIWWNFVSSSLERIERAGDDWREGRFAAVPGDDERIPLPDR